MTGNTQRYKLSPRVEDRQAEGGDEQCEISGVV